jgi:hypothetical protein
MKYDPNEFEPISSHKGKDIPYTDPGFEATGSFVGKRAHRPMQKRPWFGHKMNLEGRLYQAGVGVVLVGLGLLLGLLILSVPWKPSAIYLLVQKGFHGPYELVQVVDYETHAVIDDQQTKRMRIRADFFNFNETYIEQASFQIMQVANGMIVADQRWDCCKEGFRPQSLFTADTMIEIVDPEVDQIVIAQSP